MHEAMQHGNMYLATLIAQSGGGEPEKNSEFRNDLVQQLRLWKQPKNAWHFFSKENKDIYSILSGSVEVARYIFVCVCVCVVRILFFF